MQIHRQRDEKANKYFTKNYFLILTTNYKNLKNETKHGVPFRCLLIADVTLSWRNIPNIPNVFHFDFGQDLKLFRNFPTHL